MKSFTLMESGVFPKSLSSGKTLGLRGVWLRLFLFSSSVLCGLLCYVVESTRMINPLTMAVLRRKQLGSQGHWGLVSPGDSPQLPPPTPMQKTCLSILHCFDATCFKGHPGSTPLCSPEETLCPLLELDVPGTVPAFLYSCLQTRWAKTDGHCSCNLCSKE